MFTVQLYRYFFYLEISMSNILLDVMQLSRDKTFPSILLLLFLQKEKKEETEENIRFQSKVWQQT